MEENNEVFKDGTPSNSVGTDTVTENKIEVSEDEITRIIEDSNRQFDELTAGKEKADKKSFIVVSVLTVLICILMILTYRTAKSANNKINSLDNDNKAVTMEIDEGGH